MSPESAHSSAPTIQTTRCKDLWSCLVQRSTAVPCSYKQFQEKGDLVKVCPALLNIDCSGGVCRPGDDLSDIQPQILEAGDSLCTSFLLEIYHNLLCLMFRMRLLVEHHAARFSTSSLYAVPSLLVNQTNDCCVIHYFEHTSTL